MVHIVALTPMQRLVEDLKTLDEEQWGGLEDVMRRSSYACLDLRVGEMEYLS